MRVPTVNSKILGKCILPAILSLLLAGCAAGPATQPASPSRLPDPNEVKALLVQLVDVDKHAPGIMVGMIAADPQERWVVGYGVLSAEDERVPDGNIVTIRVDGTRIFIQLPNEPEYEIFASSETHFYLPVSDLEISFYKNDHGEVDRAVGVVEGVTYEARKVH